MGPSERTLVRRLKRGDREACRELISHYHQGVYGYLRRLGADPALAEDLTQETYAKAWSGIGTLRKAASLRSWLLTIARNQFLQVARVRRVDTVASEELPTLASGDPTPDAVVEGGERDRGLRRAVRRLDPALQETVALHYFQDLSLREVGAVLDLPVGTVKSRIHKSLALLRADLERQEADREHFGT